MIEKYNKELYIKKRNDKSFSKVVNYNIQGAIKALQVDYDSNLWIGTQSGQFAGFLYKKDANNDQLHVIYNKYPVTGLTVDKANNVYYSYYSSGWGNIIQKEANTDKFINVGLIGPDLSTIVCDNNNRLYVVGSYDKKAAIYFKEYGGPRDLKPIDSNF